jgi:hypothetical protein
VDLDDLTVILADRLAAIVPAEFHVEAVGGVLWYSADDGRFPGQSGDYRAGNSDTDLRTNFSGHGRTDEDRIVGVAVQALDELQDYIDEVPATRGQAPGTRRAPVPGSVARCCTCGTASTTTSCSPGNPHRWPPSCVQAEFLCRA